jgi:hypothetical protein
MEAEARAILAAACAGGEPEDLQRLVDRLYGARRPQRVAASLLAERRREARGE